MSTNKREEQMTHVVEKDTTTPGYKELGRESYQQIRNIIRSKIIRSFLNHKSGANTLKKRVA